MVCKRVRVWAHIRTYKHVEGRGQCHVSSSITLYFIEKVLSLNLDVTNVAKLAGQ